MQQSDVDESIYGAAVTCLDGFDLYLKSPGITEPRRDIAEELRGRFNLWAAYVGAFAAPRASLDARLVSHSDIRDMVLELLVMVQRNILQELRLNRAIPQPDSENVETADGEPPLLLGLNAVDAALSRLHSLAVAIRRSAARSYRQKVTLITPSRNMEGLCYTQFVRRRFPHARDSLVEHLGKSVHIRGRAMFYQQRHNKKIAEKREREREDPAVPAMPENTEPTIEDAGPDDLPMPVPLNANPMSETNVSSIDRQDLLRRMERVKPSLSHTSSGFSIQESQDDKFDYPKIPGTKETGHHVSCPLCGEPLELSSLTEKEWRDHVDHDMEPYVCISEECKEPLQFFVHSQDWRDHMQRMHTLDWARNVHTTTWHCDMDHAHVPNDRDMRDFDEKGDFIEHLSKAHGETLTRPQMLARTRRSRMTRIRDPFTCPLCDCQPEDVAPHIPEKPYDVLSKHIARHLKALAFFSLSYLDFDQDFSESSGSENQLAQEDGVDDAKASKASLFDTMDEEQTSTPNYHAILIGIDAYVGMHLRGCVRDIDDIKGLLQDHRNPTIPPDNIHAFTATSNGDGENPRLKGDPKSWPTYDNITRELRETTFRAQKGDHVYIHYSGQATRFEARSEFSTTSTGDLALILLSGENGDIERPLGGHKLARPLNAMVEKGLILTLVLDCCSAASFCHLGHTNVDLVSKFRDVSMLPSWMMNPNGYAVLAACGPHEAAAEIVQDGNHYGALSRFLYLTLRETGLGKQHKDIYYRLWSRFRASHLKQNPALYGNKDQGFFGQDESTNSPAIQVVQNGNHLTLQAGRAHGVTEGDDFILYPSTEASQVAGSLNMTMIATATQIQPLTSTLVLEQALASPGQEYLIAEPQTLQVQNYAITSDADVIKRDKRLLALSKRSLSDNDSTDRRCLSFSVTAIESEYKISDSSGQEVRHLPVMRKDWTSSHDISAVLEHLARYEFVKNISNPSATDEFRTSIDVNIITKTGECFGPGSVIDIEQDGSRGYMFELRVENKGKKDLYLHIFNLGPSWQIENILRGSFEILPPVDQSRGFSGQFCKKLRTAVPEEIMDRGFRSCDDFLNVLVTSQPTSFDIFELPKIGEAGKKKSSTRNGKTEEGDAQEWAAFSFHLRTTLKPGV